MEPRRSSMKTPELEPSPFPGAATTGLGVAGINLASASTASSPGSASVSASTSKTPRWGSIRQRFSSIHTRDSPSVPVDSVDDAMWDKNDAAFLEEVARDSPILLSSVENSPAPALHDSYTGRSSMSSSRVNSFILPHEARPRPPTPSAPSSSVSNSPASMAYAFPASSSAHDSIPGSSTSSYGAPAKNWPHLSRKISSVTALPHLPEQNRVDDVTTFSRPSTASSSAASSSMAPPLLPPIASSNSFMAAGFLQSPGGRSSVHSSVASSPLLAHSIHTTSDAARSNISDQYPRSPSLHSASSFTAPGSAFRSFEDRSAGLEGRVRTSSSNSATSSAFASPTSAIDRRTSRSAIGSPLAMATSFSHPRPPSPDPYLHDQLDTFPIPARSPARSPSIGNEPRPSIAGVLESPHLASPSSVGHTEHSAQSLAAETAGHTEDAAAASKKRLATASMRGIPGNAAKRSSSTVASTLFADPPGAAASNSNAGSSGPARKHTKNKSSLVSGLRKLMGKREKEGRSAAPISQTTLPAETMQPSEEQAQSHHSRAVSIDASPGSGLNLVGITPGPLGSDTTVQASHDSLPGQSQRANANTHTSPRLAHRSPSLDLLRSFGTSARVSHANAGSHEAEWAQQAAPPSPRSRAKSIDGLTRPLREVLGQRPRKEPFSKSAARSSVIEHISHNEARRLTGTSGPVYLPTQQALAEHRSRYGSSPPAAGMPDRAHFDMDLDQADRDQTRLPLRSDAISHDTDSVEMLSASGSGGAMSTTNSGSNMTGGMVSSGSSFVSASTAATDPSVTMRAPFSFQPQSYRPYSRESRTSSKEQASPAIGSNLQPGQVSGGSAMSADAANGTLRPSHRNASSLGSQAAFSSMFGSQTYEAPVDGTSTAMPPPSGMPTAKRGHNSRRSLNSLVGSRPWSSLLGSPGLGSNSSHSHHHKRVSAASISRPLSVSSSAFSSDPYFPSVEQDGADGNAGDLTLRASDFQRGANSRPNFSDPASLNNGTVTVGATILSNTHGHSSWHSPPPVPTPLGPRPGTLSPPAVPASTLASTHAISPSGSSQHSHQSHHSHSQHSHQSFHSYSSGASAPLPARGSAFAPSHRLAQHSSTSSASSSSASNFALRQQGARPPRRPTTGDGSTSPPLASSASFHSVGVSANSHPSSLIQSSSLENLGNVRIAPKPSSATALGFASAPRPPGVGHRLSASGSSLSHRKRPSFGLAIEPAAHSAFDSIPSPLLRTRRISLALPESASPERPFSTSSTSAARTPSASSFNTSPDQSARASAATLSSSSHVSDHQDNVEIETLREGSPVKVNCNDSTPLWATVPALESAMAAASLQSLAENRPAVSVPMDEGDSPRQHLEESWDRATGGVANRLSFSGGDDAHGQVSRQYMIHSPNEEEGPALAVHDANPTSQSGRMSQASKDIAFGSIAGMVSKVFEHPFDLVKVRLQTQSADRPARYAGAFDCFKQTYLQEGIRGLYRGLSMPVFGATLENACLFFTYNQIQSAIRWFNGEARSGSAAKADAEAPLSIPQLAIAAAGAGSVTSVVLTPIELIKCKMQVQMITREQHAPVVAGVSSGVGVQPQLQQTRSLYTSAVRSAASAPAVKALDGPLALLRRTIATDGIRGLWLGQTGTLLRETGGGVAWFLAFESCSRYLIARQKLQTKRDDITKKDLSSLELVGAGALAGISYNVVLFPADSVKSTMQTEQEMRAVTAVKGEKWKGTGFYDTFKKIYSTRGVRGLYAGCGVTCLRSAPSSAIIFLMYNKLEVLSDKYGL